MSKPEIITEEEALAAVKEFGMGLKNVPENIKTSEVCLEAVKKSGFALVYVPEKLMTSELCFEAVKTEEEVIKMSRQYVHLSQSEETALTVGKRHGKPVILYVMAKTMYEDEYKFYLSENNVWLVDNVPIKYIKVNKEIMR